MVSLTPQKCNNLVGNEGCPVKRLVFEQDWHRDSKHGSGIFWVYVSGANKRPMHLLKLGFMSQINWRAGCRRRRSSREGKQRFFQPIVLLLLWCVQNGVDYRFGNTGWNRFQGDDKLHHLKSKLACLHHKLKTGNHDWERPPESFGRNVGQCVAWCLRILGHR